MMNENGNIKAKLKIILKADEVIVAESVDPNLWQKVLSAINKPTAGIEDISDIGSINDIDSPPEGDNDPVSLMAKEIGVSVEDLKGACSPSQIAPFIHLDKHYWEALKKVTPARGPKALSPIIIASTLLVLWKENAKLGACTTKEAQKVLGTIGLRDDHATRALSNCEWLQIRNGTIIINPAQTSKAIIAPATKHANLSCCISN